MKGKSLCSKPEGKWLWSTPEVEMSQIPSAFTSRDMHFGLFWGTTLLLCSLIPWACSSPFFLPLLPPFNE